MLTLAGFLKSENSGGLEAQVSLEGNEELVWRYTG